MQVPRYRTAYTTIRFAPVMVDMNLPLRETLAPGPLFPRLSRSRHFSFSPSFFVPLSLAVVLCACLFKVPFCSSLCAPSPCHPHFHSANLRCSTREEQKSISRGENWVTERAWCDKKDAGWSAYGSSCTSFHKTPGNRLMYVSDILKITHKVLFNSRKSIFCR